MIIVLVGLVLWWLSHWTRQSPSIIEKVSKETEEPGAPSFSSTKKRTPASESGSAKSQSFYKRQDYQPGDEIINKSTVALQKTWLFHQNGLAKTSIPLQSFTGQPLTGEIQKYRKKNKNFHFWYGKVSGISNSDVSFVSYKDYIAGKIRIKNKLLKIYQINANQVVVEEIDQSKVPVNSGDIAGGDVTEEQLAYYKKVLKQKAESIYAQITGPARISIGYTYTSQTSAKFGSDQATEALIALAVENTTEYMQASNINAEMVLLDISKISYTNNSSNMHADLDYIQTALAGYRNKLKADIAGLAAPQCATNGVCGVAYHPLLIEAQEKDSFSYGYAVTALTGMDANIVVSHEIGHLFGACHDDIQDAAASVHCPELWARGHFIHKPMISIMAYMFSKTGFNQYVERYSSPDVNYSGYPTGDAVHDNVRQMQEWVIKVSQYYEVAHDQSIELEAPELRQVSTEKLTMEVGASATISVTLANNPNNPIFSWKKDNQSINNGSVYQGVDTLSLQIRNFDPDAHSGIYKFTASNTYGSFNVEVDVAEVPPIEIAAQPPAQVYIESGSLTTLYIQANIRAGLSNVTYEWFKDSKKIGGTTSQLRVTTAGIYKCRISSGDASAESEEIQVVVVPALENEPKSNGEPVLLQTIQDQVVAFGANLSIRANIAANESTTYQWYRVDPLTGDEIELTGQKSKTLSLKNIQFLDQGLYRLLANNADGQIESNEFMVRVKLENFKDLNIENIPINSSGDLVQFSKSNAP